MDIRKTEMPGGPVLPLKNRISFEAIFTYLEEAATNPESFLYGSAKQILKEYKQYPELREGFEDLSLLNKYNSEINTLLELFFPELLQSNEIKAVAIPFNFTLFKLTSRFQKILDRAGSDFKLRIRDFLESELYIQSCIFIMSQCYDARLNAYRPFYFDIPDVESGIPRHYRVHFNADMLSVKPLPSAPEITEEDIHQLINNAENLDLWKEKFPPGSYESSGLGMVSLFDVSTDQYLSNLRDDLLEGGDVRK